MITMMLLSLVVVFAIAVWAVQVFVRHEAGHVPSRYIDPAEAAIAEAYAHGEIDANEYWRRLDLLRSRPR